MKRWMMYVMGCALAMPAATLVAQQDAVFLHKATEGGLAEVKLGALAAQKGSNPGVRKFGQMMVNDHSALNNQIKPIAARMGVTAPDHLDAKDQAVYDHLSSLSGDAFDKAYVADMVQDHRDDLREFRHEELTTTDPQLRDATTIGVRLIAGHLHMVKHLAPEVGVTVPPMPGRRVPLPPPAPSEE